MTCPSPGAQLRGADLAVWLGVSRTPVREALLRLGQAGLVLARPGRSTTVAPLDRRALRDAESVVAAMHRLAVLEAVARMTQADLDAMRAANARFEKALAREDVHAALAADDDFHAVPVAVAANRAVATVLEQFSPILRRVELLRFSSAGARLSVTRHAALLDLCAAGDADGAAALAHQTWDSLRSLIDELPEDPDANAPGRDLREKA